MNVESIPSTPGARHRRKRVGRGVGSGHGKTATRGTKGQRARTGSRKRPGFEGGRNPLIRAIPKRGFKQKGNGQAVPFDVVNVGDLNELKSGERVSPEKLRDLGLVHRIGKRIKIKLLGDGDLSKKLTVSVHAASASARVKVEQAGGTLELLSGTSKAP